jgi:plasmid stabilization system protein ParE
MRQVIWTEAAHADLRDIYDYYAAMDSEVAERISNRILKSAESLRIVPTTRRSRTPGVLEKTVPSTRYILAFTRMVARNGDETFDIIRVVHSSLDWKPGKPPPK